MQMITFDLTYFVHLDKMYFMHFRVSFQWVPANETQPSAKYIF